jgi:hypothetical protein
MSNITKKTRGMGISLKDDVTIINKGKHVWTFWLDHEFYFLVLRNKKKKRDSNKIKRLK